MIKNPILTLLLTLFLAVLPLGAEVTDVAFSPSPILLSWDEGVTLDLSFPNPTSLRDIAAQIGEAASFSILFEPDFRDRSVAFDARSLSPEEALSVLAEQGNVFYKPLAERRLLVLDDHPTVRRAHEELGVQVFYLRHAELKDVLTTLRTIVGSKNVSAIEDQGAIVVRDTVEKLALIDTLVTSLDVSPGEIQVEALFYELNESVVSEWVQAASNSASFRYELQPGQLQSLVDRGEGRVLARPVLHLRNGRSSSFQQEALKDGTPGLLLGLESDRQTKESSISLRTVVQIAASEIKSRLALEEGAMYLLRSGTLRQSESDDRREVVLVLTATTLIEPGLASQDDLAWWVGTERTFAYPQPLELAPVEKIAK